MRMSPESPPPPHCALPSVCLVGPVQCPTQKTGSICTCDPGVLGTMTGQKQEQCVSMLCMQRCVWVQIRTLPCCHPGTVELNFISDVRCKAIGAAEGKHPKHHAHVCVRNGLLYVLMVCQAHRNIVGNQMSTRNRPYRYMAWLVLGLSLFQIGSLDGSCFPPFRL